MYKICGDCVKKKFQKIVLENVEIIVKITQFRVYVIFLLGVKKNEVEDF